MEKSDAFLVPLSVGCLCSPCCHAIPNYYPLCRSMVPKERGQNPYVGSQCSDLEAHLKVLLLSSFFFPHPVCLDYAEGECTFVQHLFLNKSVRATVILECAACLSVVGFRAAFFPTSFNRWFYMSICEMGLKNMVHNHCNACFLQAIKQHCLNLGKA